MVIYRPHRGGLAESMDEAVQFEDFNSMKEYIVKRNCEIWGKPMFSVDDIVIDEEISPDDRIGWEDVRYVCVKRYGNENFIKKYGCPQCIGYCATKYRI